MPRRSSTCRTATQPNDRRARHTDTSSRAPSSGCRKTGSCSAAFQHEPQAGLRDLRHLDATVARYRRQRLVAAGGNAPARSNLQREAEKRRVDGSRIVFAQFLPDPKDHLARRCARPIFSSTRCRTTRTQRPPTRCGPVCRSSRRAARRSFPRRGKPASHPRSRRADRGRRCRLFGAGDRAGRRFAAPGCAAPSSRPDAARHLSSMAPPSHATSSRCTCACGGVPSPARRRSTCRRADRARRPRYSSRPKRAATSRSRTMRTLRSTSGDYLESADLSVACFANAEECRR